MRLILLSLMSLYSVLADDSCQCSLFINNDHWLPEIIAFNSTSRYNVDCSNYGLATDQCKDFCIREMESMKEIIRNGVSMQDKFPPNSNLPCSEKFTPTLPFSRACGSHGYLLSYMQYGPSVCCDSTGLIHWCSYMDAHYAQEQDFVEGRKLDLQKDKKHISQNEIDVMEKPIKEKIKIGSVLVNKPSITPESWTESIMTFFGYNNFMDLVKNVDIFSLPGKIQGAIKDYRAELSMGRCYMEFTTFKLFTKQENPFGDILRKKRDVGSTLEEAEEFNESPKKLGQIQAIEALVSRFVERYAKAEEARQYSSLITTAMRLFSQFMSSQGSQNGGAASLLSLAGPLLSQMSSRPNEAYPTSGGTDGDLESSPLPMMAMQLLGGLFENYFAPSENVTKGKVPPYPSYSKPSQSSGPSSMLQMLANGVASAPPPSPVKKKNPTVNQIRPEIVKVEEKPKSFANMLLDLIRPVFISIVGNTPGESGVEAIRRMSLLSTNGRVDNTLKDEVDSPFFCFKRYAVNKAWSLTEMGVNTLVTKFTPDEQESFRRALF